MPLRIASPGIAHAEAVVAVPADGPCQPRHWLLGFLPLALLPTIDSLCAILSCLILFMSQTQTMCIL